MPGNKLLNARSGRTVCIAFILLFLLSGLTTKAQPKTPKVSTVDIDNFWMAYDSIRATNDSLRQLQLIQTLYIDRGTGGLKAFMEAREYSAGLWVQLINRYPKFWNSIRPSTLAVKTQAAEIESSLRRLQQLYPRLKEAEMYFTIGGLRSGGTTSGNKVLVGTEIAAGNAQTNVSEFTDGWLKNVFAAQQQNNIVALNVHEYIHTQQHGEARNVLGQAISEGACDFITELVIGRPITSAYITYGNAHEAAVKEKFRREMFSGAYGNWLYNGSNAGTMADLGYYMGYAICKAYYKGARNKKKAVRKIIELDYSDSNAVENFLRRSGYYADGFDKAELMRQFEAAQPRVLRLEPFANGDSLVDASAKELRIVFSLPMKEKRYSIDFGEKGKEFFPIVGVAGFSNNGTSFTLKLDLKPDHEYEFVITGRSFASADGYPLVNETVRFRTR